MGYWCADCQREFVTLNGLHQHRANAAVHQNQYSWSSSSSEAYYSEDNDSEPNDAWECEHCDKQFATEHARHQHSSNASFHPYCQSCKRMFTNDHNLQQVSQTQLDGYQVPAKLTSFSIFVRESTGEAMQSSVHSVRTASSWRLASSSTSSLADAPRLA